MAIPDFEATMLPLLKIAGDGKEHSITDTVNSLARQFNLTEEERQQLQPSGSDRLFNNRVRWARFDLGKAGLLESVGWGRFRISQRGMDVLKEKPEAIDETFLRRYPEFQQLKRGSAQEAAPTESAAPIQPSKTPEENLDATFRQLRQKLEEELLARVKGCSWQFFEKLVVKLLVAMGYGGAADDEQRVGRGRDGGIDGVIKEDRLGFDAVYLQAKQWPDNTVGRPVVQAFAGSMEGQKARKGVFITTSRFSQDAKDYVQRLERKIVLIDGERLAQLMIDYSVGVEDVAVYKVQRVDLNYFEESE